MKIAIPTDENNMKTEICQSFGRAPFILIYDTVTGENEFLDNSAAASEGGAGIRVAQVIADHGVKAVLTPRCGENAEKVLKKAEVLIYRTIPGTARQNIEFFNSEKLSLLYEIHPGFHGHE
ncbi:MAG: NifB/NifX family molybdenum-iron cluster-binding protein [Saccharofermentanales bacterium]